MLSNYNPRRTVTIPAMAGAAGRFAAKWAGRKISRWAKNKLRNRQSNISSTAPPSTVQSISRFRPINNDSVYSFRHTLVVQFPVIGGPTGAGGNGFLLGGTTANTTNLGLGIYWTPTTFVVYNANAGNSTTQIPNASSYAAIFEQCRLAAVEVKVYYNDNIGGNVYSLSTVLPQLQTCFETEPVLSAPVALSTLADYPNLQLCQLGTSAMGHKSGASFARTYKPKSSITNVGNAQCCVAKGNEWMNIAAGGQTSPYYGLLQYLDWYGLSSVGATATVGVLTYYVTLCTDYKGLI